MRGFVVAGFIAFLRFEVKASMKAAAFQQTTLHYLSFSASSSSSLLMTRRKPVLSASMLDADLKHEQKAAMSRRNVLLASLSAATVAAGASSASLLSGRSSNKIKSNAVNLATVGEAIAWIDENCDRRFLHAVVASDYRFLYRGVDTTDISIRNEEPDLLLPETYGSSPEALQFFRELETVLKDDAVRPSNGHLATTSAQDAAAWGTAAASIWPMGPAHYAWFQNGGLFYPRASVSSSLDRKSIIVDGRDCGKDNLEDALQGDSWEVMVATPCFLTVPLSMETELRDGLQKSFLV